MRADYRQRGLTLIELMVAMGLGLFLTAGLATLFVATNRSHRQNELIAGMQDQGRFGLATLSRDIAMVGYWGGMLGSQNIRPNVLNEDETDDSSSAIAALPASADCGADAGASWSFDLRERVEFRNHDESGDPDARWRCLGNVVPGTDVVALRRVSGQVSGQMDEGGSNPRLRPWGFYLQTNGVIGTVVRWGASVEAAPEAGAEPASAPMRFYRYVPRIYFVRDFARRPGDGIPSLCRKELCATRYAPNADPELATCGSSTAAETAAGWFTECIAEGVEDLQITWGLDGEADTDQAVDRYTSTPSAGELMTQARMAQVQLRVRARRGEGQYLDEKTYTLGDAEPFTPGEIDDAPGTPVTESLRRYYRRVYGTTVQLRNP